MKKILRRKFKKVKHVRELVPDSVAEKAANLNPLNSKPPETPSLENVPQITNETIAEHREQVLKGARKYIYPLAHSKHRIVLVTSVIGVVAAITFFIYCSLALYKFYQYNTFLYRVTQVVPFPIAKTGGDYVGYENYLFELRHYVHYYQTQQQSLFGGDKQIKVFRKQALNDVVNNAVIKQLSQKNKVSVSNKEVNDRLAEVRDQNRLGTNDKVFANVLRDYWGWSISDFKRSLKQEILSEKLTAKLDSATQARADTALAQVRTGTDFASLAKQVSDDPNAKSSGGDYGFAITKTNPNVPPEVVDALFSLKPGQISGVILASPVLAGQGPTLQIVKVIQNNGVSVTALHMVFTLQSISPQIEALKTKEHVTNYVHF